jgi:hypothetical protein
MARRRADPRLAGALRAAGHPLRLAILLALKNDGPTSPSGFARADDSASLGRSAYHFRALAEGELIALEGTRTARGAIEHRYVLTPLGSALIEVLPRLARAA